MINIYDKNCIILKQNPLILAEFAEAFSEVDHDVLNILLYSLQTILVNEKEQLNLFNYRNIVERKLIISANTFKKLGKFGHNGNKEIFEALKKIRDTSGIIRNFTDHNGVKYKAATLSILDSVKLLENYGSDKRLDGFEVQYSEMFMIMGTIHFNQQVGNFSKIKVVDVSSINSRYAKKLYEILESKRFRATEFSLSLEELRAIFSLKDKTLSYFVDRIRTAKPKVYPLVPFEFEVFKKDKIISFKILDVN